MRIFLVFISLFTINLFSKEFKNDGFFRYVQVLAIRDFSRAQKVMKKLDSYGYDYIVRDSNKKGEQYFRVVVGPFSKDSIKKEQNKLEKLLYIKSSFILKYETKPSSTVNIHKVTPKEKVIKPKFIDTKDYKKRIDKIVKLSFTKENFIQNKEFVCGELNSLVQANYPPAILLLASNYIKGDECVEQDLSKAIEYLKGMQKEQKGLPANLAKFSKELLAETYLKTMDRDNLLFARKLFDELLLDETNKDKYTIYLYKRLAYIEYLLKEYKYMNFWLLEAAKLGDIESQINLAKNHIKGLGYEKDIKKAIFWFEQCMNKSIQCSENLGNIYMNLNFEIAPNLDKAFTYFEKASALGSLESKKVLENKDKIREFYSLMQSDDIKYKLVGEYLYRSIKDDNIQNMFITNIQQSKENYNVFTSFSTKGKEKVAKLVFQKTKHNYWIVRDFKIADSILNLK